REMKAKVKGKAQAVKEKAQELSNSVKERLEDVLQPKMVTPEGFVMKAAKTENKAVGVGRTANQKKWDETYKKTDTPGGKPPEKVPKGPDDDAGFTVTLEYKEGMNKRDFERKAKYLERLSKEGNLTRAQNPVKRNKYITEKYKKDVKKRIERMYGKKDPEKAKELIKRVDTMNPDHMWDLQLNGPDTRRNLKLLDGYTNQQLGRDVWNQIRDVKKVPVGTPIKIVVKR
ncbi:hypothetical protein EDM57_22400, partial [Brevibacillus gelatini]